MSAAYNTDSARWRAIATRDPLASAAFIYAVHTTHIYCRPTCPARLARRANISFYDNATLAAAAGYRPCKRCAPDCGDAVPPHAAVEAVRGLVEKGGEGGSLGEMAKRAGLSKWHFHRTFVKVVGITPAEWVRRRRETERAGSDVSETVACSASRSGSGSDDSEGRTAESAESDGGLGLGMEISEEEWERLICFEGMDEKGEEWERFLNLEVI